MVITPSERIRIILFLMSVIVLSVLFIFLFPFYEDVKYLIGSHSLLGPLIYSLLMILAILIAPIPSSPLAIIAGSVFGPWQGMLYTLIAATLGAVTAFVLARYFFGEIARNHLKSYTWYKKFSNVSEYRIAYIISLTRLMPQVSFDLVSYAAGLTRIRLSLFTLATFIGMIPIVFLLSFFGYLLQPYQELMLIVLFLLFLCWFVYKFVKIISGK